MTTTLPNLLPLDERNLNPHRRRDVQTGDYEPDLAMDGLGQAMRKGMAAAEKINALAGALKADTTLSPSERAVQLRQNALRVGEAAAVELDDAKAKLIREVELVDKATSVPPAPRDPIGLQMESELRAALRSMKEEQREKLLCDLDDRIAAAVLRAHPATVGVTSDAQALYRERWRKAKFPAEADRLARLRKAGEVAERAGHALLAFVTKHAKPGADVEAAAARREAIVKEVAA
ncbi:MAG: hypothetical protein KDJ72_01950 [Methyloceanibacter sp.]|uniref:hypothetical protein n=1 Tax=Methyloceanibacter sp. TaxID=1965321 RepID=UPI001DB35A6D|nr:hypothetical protein [Methyloceanibacter sp.]MCB1441758.1 hypothetical protein [Methyloceanibacter sp.]